MLFNPFAKVKVRMLVAIMVDFRKVMMDRKGGPKGHHYKEQGRQWDGDPNSERFSPKGIGHGQDLFFPNFQHGYHTI